MEERGKNEKVRVDGKVDDHPLSSSIISARPPITISLEGIEEQIFNLAKELMKHHYILKVSDLIKISTQRIKNESNSTILVSINNLIAKKVIFEGKAIHKGSILENTTRNAIYNMIVAEPGIYAYKIRSNLKKDARSVSLHLSLLKQFGLIRSKDYGNNRVYYASELKNEDFDYLYYYLHKKHVIEIFKMVINYPSISFQDLSDLIKVEITKSNLLRKINVLIQEGFLTAMYDSNQIIALNLHTKYKQEVNNYLEVQNS
ncbi:MAG: hypothetical protein ACFFCS_25640, partial [Candidatus Hodarchaeota archaeon]